MSRNARFEAAEFAANTSPLPWRFDEVVTFSYRIAEAGRGVMAKKLLAKGLRNLAKFDGARTYVEPWRQCKFCKDLGSEA